MTTNETTTTDKTITITQYLDSKTKLPATWAESHPLTIPGPYSGIDAMKRANEANGRYYFDNDAIRFFRARVYPQTFYGRFFIDSIQFVSSQGEKEARKYQILAMTDEGKTLSVVALDHEGVWRESFPTLESAKRALHRLVKENA